MKQSNITNKLITQFLSQNLPITDVTPEEYLKGRLEQLDDLTKRLQDDYAGGEDHRDFEQDEEDRLCTYDLCELLEFLIIKMQDRGKFKVGDKVKHKDFGVGKNIYIQVNDKYLPYAVEFENEHNGSTHDFALTYKWAGLSNPIDRKAGYWCSEEDLKLVTDEPKNLIPEIAKMLGVEIGEEFKVSNRENELYKFTSDYLMKNEVGRTSWGEEWYMLGKLLSGYHTIVKLPKTPKLTEAERVILEELFKKYTKIIRIETTELWVYNHSEDWKELAALSHLFQFIGEYRKEYDIEELLKGE